MDQSLKRVSGLALVLLLCLPLDGYTREVPALLGGIECDPGVNGNCLQASATFNKAIQHRYPLRSDAAAMIKDLLGMGFSYSGPRGFTHCQPLPNRAGDAVKGPFVPCPALDVRWNPQDQVQYNLHPHSLDCGGASVLWSSDRNGELTYVEGRFGKNGARCDWP